MNGEIIYVYNIDLIFILYAVKKQKRLHLCNGRSMVSTSWKDWHQVSCSV